MLNLRNLSLNLYISLLFHLSHSASNKLFLFITMNTFIIITNIWFNKRIFHIEYHQLILINMVQLINKFSGDSKFY